VHIEKYPGSACRGNGDTVIGGIGHNMEIEEAISVIKEMNVILLRSCKFTREMEQAEKVAFEAMEKQIKRRTKARLEPPYFLESNRLQTKEICPNCYWEIEDLKSRYCGWCGQRLNRGW
jgi:hypothetical protein